MNEVHVVLALGGAQELAMALEGSPAIPGVDRERDAAAVPRRRSGSEWKTAWHGQTTAWF